jgi:hypothetical protein
MPGNQQPVGDTAAGPHHFGPRHVVQAHQQTRSEVEQAATAVRLVDQHAADAKIADTDGYRVAQTKAERRKQP